MEEKIILLFSPSRSSHQLLVRCRVVDPLVDVTCCGDHVVVASIAWLRGWPGGTLGTAASSTAGLLMAGLRVVGLNIRLGSAGLRAAGLESAGLESARQKGARKNNSRRSVGCKSIG